MYKTLVKVLLKENFSLNRVLQIGSTKSKSKMILMSVILVYVLVVFIGSSGYLFSSLGSLFASMGIINLLLVYTFFYQLVLTFIFALFRSNGYMFQYKDYQILAPLPIKSTTITFAKVTVMMIFVYISTLLFTSPIIVSYFYYGGFSILKLVQYILIFLVTPFIPIIIFSFLSLGIARITARIKNAKIVSTVLMLFVFLGTMYLSFSVNASSVNPFLGQQNFMNSLKELYLPLLWYVESIDQGNLLSTLAFVSINLIPFVIYLFFIQKIVSKTNQLGLQVVVSKTVKMAKNQEKSMMRSIISKEFRRYLNSPIYTLNTGAGVIMMMMLGIGSLFFKSSIEPYLYSITSLDLPIELLVLAIISFTLSMTYTSAISLSLEGKQLWILKSLPIKASDLMVSKMVFNVIIGGVASAITIILLTFSFEFSILSAFLMLLFVISFSFLTSMIGSVINLHFPKLNFRNDTEVVKQSVASVIALFGNMTFIVLYGLLIYLLNSYLSVEVLIFITILMNSIFFLVAYFYVTKNANRLINNMQA